MYTDIQKNKMRWYLMAFAMLLPIAVISYKKLWESIENEWLLYFMFISSYIFSFGFTYLVMFKRIETQIDANEVRYRFFPWSGWHKIPWSEIDEAYIREFALVGEYPQGIGGIRQGPGGWVYSMNGTTGLAVGQKKWRPYPSRYAAPHRT